MKQAIVALLVVCASAHEHGHHHVHRHEVQLAANSLEAPRTADQLIMVEAVQMVCASDVNKLRVEGVCVEPAENAMTDEQIKRLRSKRLAMWIADMLFPGLFLKMQMARMYFYFMSQQAEPTPVYLGFGEATDKCLLKHFKQTSTQCQTAIFEVQQLAWQQFDVSAPEPHRTRHHCMFGIVLFALFVASLLFSGIMGARSAMYGSVGQRRRQMMRVLNIIRDDFDLRWKVEGQLGERLHRPHPSENPGCCIRLWRVLFALTFSMLIVVAGLGPLIILWSSVFWLAFVLCACVKCCCGSTDELDELPTSGQLPTNPDSELPSGPPPAYKEGAVTGYFTLHEADAQPGVVLATRHVFSV